MTEYSQKKLDISWRMFMEEVDKLHPYKPSIISRIIDKMGFALILYLLLNIFDTGLTTYLCYIYGIGLELNPVRVAFMEIFGVIKGNIVFFSIEISFVRLFTYDKFSFENQSLFNTLSFFHFIGGLSGVFFIFEIPIFFYLVLFLLEIFDYLVEFVKTGINFWI